MLFHSSKVSFLLQATQVKYSTDEFHQRILYEYLAEASVVFPKVFPVVWVSLTYLHYIRIYPSWHNKYRDLEFPQRI